MRSETHALLMRLAWERTKEDCPNRDEVNYYGRAGFPSSRAHIYEDWSHYRQEGRDLCPICRGTGKVFLFPDDVRVECKQIHNLFNQEGSSSSIRSASCSEVGCLGWIPSTDLMMWVKGLYQVLSLIFTRQRHRWTDEVWVCWIGYHKALIRGDFEAALPHAVKAMELTGMLEVAHEPTS